MYDNTNKGALWFKNDKNGNRYQNGKININGNEFWISVFENNKKTNPNQPDFNVSIQPCVAQQNAQAVNQVFNTPPQVENKINQLDQVANDDPWNNVQIPNDNNIQF